MHANSWSTGKYVRDLKLYNHYTRCYYLDVLRGNENVAVSAAGAFIDGKLFAEYFEYALIVRFFDTRTAYRDIEKYQSLAKRFNGVQNAFDELEIPLALQAILCKD